MRHPTLDALTFKQRILGSSPSALTRFFNYLAAGLVWSCFPENPIGKRMGSKLGLQGNLPEIFIGSLQFPASYCLWRTSGIGWRADL